LEIKKGWIKVERVELSPEVKEIGEELGLHKGEVYALSLALHIKSKDFLADDKLARIAGSKNHGVESCWMLGHYNKSIQK